MLFSMLNKLHLTSSHSAESIRTVLELIAEATETRLATDATSRNVLTKLQTTLLKLIHDAAGAERGAEETGVDSSTILTGANTPSRRRRTKAPASDEEVDEVTMQLQRELEATRIEEDESKLSAIGEGTEVEEEFDTSQLPDEKEMQSLVESLDDEDDEDLL